MDDNLGTFTCAEVHRERYARDRDPEECPICHVSVLPEQRGWSLAQPPRADQPILEIVYRCPRQQCGHLFIGQFRLPPEAGRTSRISFNDKFMLFRVRPSTPRKANIPDEVQQVSPMFGIIYAQADAADAYGLNHVAGMAYRKALEFLVKDYSILRHPGEDETIKSKKLAVCIKDYVDDQRVKQCANGVRCLGNDETHYIRKLQGKDIEDLKTLLTLTVNWLHNTILTEKYQQDMNL